MPEPKLVDFLTGFSLRDSLPPFLEQLMLDASRDHKDFSIVLIDVDRFKKYNDKFGHFFGDKVLEHVANVFRLTFKEDECKFFRYGGDEFIIVLLNKSSEDAHRLVLNCTMNFQRHHFLFKGKYHNITISCGIANYPVDGLTADELVQKADKAMYFSKTHGRNCVTLASRIRYLSFRNSLILIFVTFVVFTLAFLSCQTAFMRKILSKIEKIKYLKIIPEPIVKKVRIITEQKVKDVKIIPELEDLTVIVLKDGRRFEGRIVKETEDEIELSLNLFDGKVIMKLDKSKIAQIEHSSSTTSPLK